ncbi:hypothetical protein [Archangium primigenium]|uniref:hypothetical protein n=1 Tax=[Archangium] primigenium TaxID=2792470 RepID=UPI00195DB7AF|nr:hypothetical protein [Archangium primigenium]MBM7119352.1 hypothetical protein [Archangium primigenium]
MSVTKIFYKDQELANERLELTDKNAIYFLGPNLVLRDCTLHLKVAARNLLMREVRFHGCTFEVTQELKNHQDWLGASLEGCRFKGRLRGCDFGHWPEYGNEPEYQCGAISDCDFTEAQLHACRFIACDPHTLKLPRWPCFSILDPLHRAPELSSAAWPDLFTRVIIQQLHTHPPRTRALTLHAPTVARQLETTPEALRPLIETFDRMVY